MSQSDSNVLRRWFEEVWNEGREDLMEALAVPEVIAHGVGGPNQVMQGLDAFRSFYRTIRAAFSDIRFTIEEAIGERDIVAVRWSAQMTHSGDALGFPATHKQVALTGMSFARVRDGKIVDTWDNWDMMGLMHAIGQTQHAEVVALGETG